MKSSESDLYIDVRQITLTIDEENTRRNFLKLDMIKCYIARNEVLV